MAASFSTRYLSYTPPSVQVWYGAVFSWVQVQGRSPDASGSPKNAPGPVVIPLKEAPRVPGDKPNPPEEG